MSDVYITQPPQPETAPAETFREPRVTMTKTPHGQPLLKIEVEGDGRPMGGSTCRAFNETILHETLACLPGLPDDPDAMTRRVTAGHAALAAFAPKDEVEAMIAAQAVAMHHASMECFRR